MVRPLTVDFKVLDLILPLLRLGHTVSAACESCGISVRTFYSWLAMGRNNPEKYPELASFLHRYIEAKGAGILELEICALKAGKLNGDTAIKILERRRGRDWGQQNWRIRQMERELAEAQKALAELKAMLMGKVNGDVIFPGMGTSPD